MIHICLFICVCVCAKDNNARWAAYNVQVLLEVMVRDIEKRKQAEENNWKEMAIKKGI